MALFRGTPLFTYHLILKLKDYNSTYLSGSCDRFFEGKKDDLILLDNSIIHPMRSPEAPSDNTIGMLLDLQEKPTI